MNPWIPKRTFEAAASRLENEHTHTDTWTVLSHATPAKGMCRRKKKKNARGHTHSRIAEC